MALAGLLLLWPARPHTMLACSYASSTLEGNFLHLRWDEHKRAPPSHTFTVFLPKAWLPVFERLWTPVRQLEGHQYLFGVDGSRPKGLAEAQAAFVTHFKPAAPHFALYDMRRLAATCYYKCGVPTDKLLRLGGW